MLRFKRNLDGRLDELREEASELEGACDEIRGSARLKKLLAIVLKVRRPSEYGALPYPRCPARG